MLAEEAPVAHHLQGSSGRVSFECSALVATASELRRHDPMLAEEAPVAHHLQGSSGRVSFECSSVVANASERRRHDRMHAEGAPVVHHLHGCSGGKNPGAPTIHLCDKQLSGLGEALRQQCRGRIGQGPDMAPLSLRQTVKRHGP